MCRYELFLHLRSKKENAFVAPIKGLSGSGLGGKLNNALPRGTSTIIHNDNCSFNHSKLRKGLFEELIGNKWRQVLHREGCRVCGKSHSKWSAFHWGVIQLCLCNLRKRPGLLQKSNAVYVDKPLYSGVYICFLENLRIKILPDG